METPNIMKRNGYTMIDMVVRLRFGFGCVRTVSAITRECKKYPGEIYFQKSIYNSICPRTYANCTSQEILPQKYNCKKMLETMISVIDHEDRIRVSVEGDDESARRVALRLYSAITSEDDRDLENVNINFNRFEVVEK